MDVEKLLKLVDAGFTKDEIMALAQPKAEEPKAEEPKVEEVPAEPEVKKNSDSSDELKTRIDDLEKLVQAKNREDAVFDTPPKETTVDDIFKSVFGLEPDN